MEAKDKGAAADAASLNSILLGAPLSLAPVQ